MFVGISGWWVNNCCFKFDPAAVNKSGIISDKFKKMFDIPVSVSFIDNIST